MGVRPDETSALRISPGPAKKLGKLQQRFNTLIRKVSTMRRAIAAWSTATPELHRAVSEHARLQRTYYERLADLVRLLDRQIASGALSVRDEHQLGMMVAELARELMERAPSDDVKAIYNRHARANFDAEAARDEAARLELIKELAEEELGIQLDDDVSSFDELEAKLAAAAEERERAAEARRARRRKSPKQVEREAARERERVDTSKSLQEIYRKLARALHPDHELDPEERVRKTLLMQDVNIAYEAGDLLRLLELQLQVEQVDRAHLDNLADDRLAHFNRLLVEQVAQLERDLAGAEETWRGSLERGSSRRITPPHVLAAIRADLGAFARDIADVQRDLDAFEDPRAVAVWIAAKRPRRR